MRLGMNHKACSQSKGLCMRKPAQIKTQLNKAGYLSGYEYESE
jgi:hypothetical protein